MMRPDSVLPLWLDAVVLVVVTVAVAFCADYLVASIMGLSDSWNITPTFIGLSLLPIVGGVAKNIFEQMIAIRMAIETRMDLMIGVAIGTTMQIALFIVLLMAINDWIIHEPMALFFGTFETCILFISALVVDYLIQGGKSNWFTGVMLLNTYVIIVIAFYFYNAPA
ncbi:hypothetical protein BGZ54_007196 [Gamsiella multidivaricata]|nr:hypothetical protein BGZ54_007196 [Gamsiella multidivaricata]